MYTWLWSKLPGNVWVKTACSVGLVLALVALLWFVIFPWVEPLLPFGDVTVDGGESVSLGARIHG